MSEDQSETPRNAILAAGGIVLGTGDDTGKCHRPATPLPRNCASEGKLKNEKGQSKQHCEVYEETGCKTK
jgi:hypothetical protein